MCKTTCQTIVVLMCILYSVQHTPIINKQNYYKAILRYKLCHFPILNLIQWNTIRWTFKLSWAKKGGTYSLEKKSITTICMSSKWLCHQRFFTSRLNGMVMGWVAMLFLFFFSLGHLAFGGMPGEEVGTFRSFSISLHCKPQNSFRNDHFPNLPEIIFLVSRIFQIFRFSEM